MSELNSKSHDRAAGELLGSLPLRSPVFATTRWSMVLAAGNELSPESTAALERLCQAYWYPLYAHVRRRGHSEADAQDLTQAFFSHLLERNSFQQISPTKGKFRSFLLASMNYFLSDAHDRNMAQKRGGRFKLVSFDAHTAEERFALEPCDHDSPDKIFERRWALALLDQVLVRLKSEFETAGKGDQFTRLSLYLVENSGEASYAQAAQKSGQTEEAFKKAVQRMRRRYGELFREEIANTVAVESEVDQELRYLCELMASSSAS